MRRVMIVGGSGSGKSTLARWLGARTGLPVFHMDHIHWMPGWQERAPEDKRVLAHQVELRPDWIFEGGFSRSYDHRATRADTLIWLDLAVGLRLWRVTKRLALHWGRQGPDMAEGCREGFHAETLPFFRFIWNTRHSHRRRIVQVVQDHPHLDVYHLRTRADLRAFKGAAPWDT